MGQPGCYSPGQVCEPVCGRDWIRFPWNMLQGWREKVYVKQKVACRQRASPDKATAGVQAVRAQEGLLCFHVSSSRLVFSLQKMATSADLCLDKNRTVEIAKPLWCAYSASRQSYLTSSGTPHRSYCCSMGRVNLVIVLKAAEFSEDHIVLVVHCPSGCCYGSPNNLQKKPYPWKCFWLHWLYI